MKSDLDNPDLWILEIKRLNRKVEKCNNGIRRSREQMHTIVLTRMPKRRSESVITSLIGSKAFGHKDFIGKIIGHNQVFVEPFMNKVNYGITKQGRRAR